VLQHLLVLLFLDELLGRSHLGDDDAGISGRLLELIGVPPRDGLVDRLVVVRAVQERQGLLVQPRVTLAVKIRSGMIGRGGRSRSARRGRCPLSSGTPQVPGRLADPS
jgi:hypothetical protein